MARKQRRSKGPLIFLLVLSALLCVGAVELAVCRVADPALYARITGPALAWLSQAKETVIDTADSLAQRLTPPAPTEPVEPPESQRSGEAALFLDVSTADRTLTRLDLRESGEWLTGGSMEIRYFCQTDPTWAEEPYGRDNIGAYGCGPTAMAMAVASLTGAATDPLLMSDWAYQDGHWSRGNGSRLSLIQRAGKAHGLEVTAFTDPTAQQLLQELAAGKLAVALMTKGHFTQGGHFILLRGATLEGQVLVADPVSRERSLVPWDPQLILDELSPSRSDGAPLWLLSPAKEG